MAGEMIIRRAETAQSVKGFTHPGYECSKRIIVGKEDSQHFNVTVYEVPPGKSAVPYHYHMRNEEVFYILSGKGLLKSPEGEREVTTGDFIYFPNNENGAHKLTNISQSELLVYADFDIMHDPEIAFYPDSDKVGLFGSGKRMIFPISKQVGYFDGE